MLAKPNDVVWCRYGYLFYVRDVDDGTPRGAMLCTPHGHPPEEQGFTPGPFCCQILDESDPRYGEALALMMAYEMGVRDAR